MEFLSLIITSVVIMLASLLGVFFVSKKISTWAEENMHYLVAFAGGVFLIVAYDLVFEAFEFGTSAIVVTMSIIIGFLLFYFFEKLYPEVHCHHDDKHCVGNKTKQGANKILIGDAFHNMGDGLLLAPIFAIDIRLGIIAGIGVFIHEAVQEVSEFFVLRAAGYTNKEALIRNFVVSSTIIIGAVAGYYIASIEILIGPLLGLAAGAFIYILAIDLLPESIKHSHREQKYVHIAVWILFGILLVLSINTLVGHFLEEKGLGPHGHGIEEDHHDDE